LYTEKTHEIEADPESLQIRVSTVLPVVRRSLPIAALLRCLSYGDALYLLRQRPGSSNVIAAIARWSAACWASLRSAPTYAVPCRASNTTARRSRAVVALRLLRAPGSTRPAGNAPNFSAAPPPSPLPREKARVRATSAARLPSFRWQSYRPKPLGVRPNFSRLKDNTPARVN